MCLKRGTADHGVIRKTLKAVTDLRLHGSPSQETERGNGVIVWETIGYLEISDEDERVTILV